MRKCYEEEGDGWISIKNVHIKRIESKIHLGKHYEARREREREKTIAVTLLLLQQEEPTWAQIKKE